MIAWSIKLFEPSKTHQILVFNKLCKRVKTNRGQSKYQVMNILCR